MKDTHASVPFNFKIKARFSLNSIISPVGLGPWSGRVLSNYELLVIDLKLGTSDVWVDLLFTHLLSKAKCHSEETRPDAHHTIIPARFKSHYSLAIFQLSSAVMQYFLYVYTWVQEEQFMN